MGDRGRPTSIGSLFDWHAEARRQTVMHLDRPFDVAPEGGLRHDAASLASIVSEASGWLHAAGLRRGDRLVVVKDNHYDVLMLAAAAARLGALPVLIAPLSSIDAIRTMTIRADPAVVVASPRILELAVRAGCELGGPRTRIVVLGEPGDGAPPGAMRLAELRGAAAPSPRPVRDDEPMIVTHTSGTTGVPKLVVHSARTILGTMSRLESLRLPIVASRLDDVVAIAVPFAHARAVSWTAGQFGLTPRGLVVVSDFGIDNVARTLDEHRPTTLEACPNVFQHWEELAVARPELFRQVRLFAATFDAVHPRTVRTFLGASARRFPLWAQGWGQSEVGPVSVATFTRRQVRKRGGARAVTSDIGWPVPVLVKARVVDPETGRRQPRGVPGLLMVSTKGRCLDYLGESDRHRDKRDGEWWSTGDVGERGRFGRLRLVDREVDVIPGGSAIELESILLDRLQRADEVAVLGVPDRLPVPIVCTRDGRLDPDEWRAATAGLPPMEEPRLVSWDEVPRTATWKVRRLELREQVLGTKESIGTGRWT
ncbi:MAG: AMP-binding protein [Frankiaceae bacterium]